MKNEMSSYFEDPEFKEALEKYEGMVESHTPAYFDADELTDIAEYYASNGRHKDAEKVINFALKLHPNDTDALIFQARSLALEGKLDEAYKVADLIEDRTDREFKFLQADLLMEEGRMEEADEIFKQLVIDEENDLDTLLDIILDYIDVNQKVYAENWLIYMAKWFDLTKLPQKSQRYRDVLCDFYAMFNKPDMIIPYLRMTLDQHPYSVQHWNELGKCYLQLDKFDEAHEAFDFALAIDDKDEVALALKAFTYKHSVNLEDAIRMYKKLVEVTGNKIQPLMTLATTYFEAQDYESALKYMLDLYDRKSELSEYEQAELNTNLALCYAGMGTPKDGYEYIRTAKDQNGKDPEICVNIGRFYLMNDDLTDDEREEIALSEFNDALKCTPDDERYDTLRSIASTCFDTHNFKLAAKYFEQIISEFPLKAKINYLFLVYCYFQLQQLKPCMHYMAKIKEEITEMYNGLGADDELMQDKDFNDFLRELKAGINDGKIDLDKYL